VSEPGAQRPDQKETLKTTRIPDPVAALPVLTHATDTPPVTKIPPSSYNYLGETNRNPKSRFRCDLGPQAPFSADVAGDDRGSDGIRYGSLSDSGF